MAIAFFIGALILQTQVAEPAQNAPSAQGQAQAVTAQPTTAEERDDAVTCEWRAPTGGLVRQRVCRTNRSARASRDQASAYLDDLSRAASALVDRPPVP